LFFLEKRTTKTSNKNYLLKMLFMPSYKKNNNCKIFWQSLSKNPNAIHILENNLDKVWWSSLSINPNAIHLLFKYDYETMKQNNKDFCEELVQKVFNPERLLSLCKMFNMDLLDYTDIINPE